MTRVVRQSNPQAFERLNAGLKALENVTAKAGWFESAKYEDGTSVAYVATIQEFGYPSGNIPPRPFMRPTVTKHKPEWIGIMQRGAKAVIEGTTTAENVMDQLGGRVAGQIQQSITEVYSPPLSPKTIANRLRRRKDKTVTKTLAKPLVDTGYMLSTVTHLTEEKS